MNKNKMAYTEVLELLKYLPKEEYNKIPKSEIEFLEQNKQEDYDFKFNENLSFEEQIILPETEAYIIRLYKNYFCTPEQRLVIDKKLHLNEELYIIKRGTVSELFASKHDNAEPKKSASTNLIEPVKPKWYERLLKAFKSKKKKAHGV